MGQNLINDQKLLQVSLHVFVNLKKSQYTNVIQKLSYHDRSAKFPELSMELAMTEEMWQPTQKRNVMPTAKSQGYVQ